MRRIESLFYAAAVLIIFMLSGCVSVSSSPVPRFYMASSIVKDQAAEKLDISPGVIIAVGPITIPEYQDRPQIVTKNKNGTLVFAQFDRWGEPLDSGLARLITDGLAVTLPEASLQVFPCNFAIPVDYQVIVDVVQLDSELDKDMLLAAQWTIIDVKNKHMLFTKKSWFTEPINPHNYFGLTKALGGVCFSLSREIAENLAGLAKK